MRLNILILAISALSGLTGAAAIPPRETGISYSSFQSAADFLQGFGRAARIFVDTIKDSASEVLSQQEGKGDLGIEADRRLNDLKEINSQTIEQPEHLFSNVTWIDSCKPIWDSLSPKAIAAVPILEMLVQMVGNQTFWFVMDNFDDYSEGVRHLLQNKDTPLAPGVREQCFKSLVKTIHQAARSALEKLEEVVKGRSA